MSTKYLTTTMTTCFSKKTILNAGRVIGKSHISSHTPCQDFYRIRQRKYGYALAVCDGVGSQKHSLDGSKAACKAVLKTFDLYHKKKIAKDEIGKTIEHFYNRYVPKRHRKCASTTCLFVLIYKDSEIIIGQAGDGAILIKADSRFAVFKRKDDDFENEVIALSCGRPYSNWKIKTLKFDFNKNEKLDLLLTSDGISEDVIPGKMEDCLDYFINLSKTSFDKSVQNALENWDVPGSIDDKSMITFSWRK